MKTFEFGSVNLYLILFRNVKNTKILLDEILNNKGESACAIVRVKYICDPLQIAVAGGKTFMSKQNSRMVTKNVYTELLYNLSTTKNITKSLKTFGVDKDDTDMILAHFGDEVSLEKAASRIDGQQVEWTELAQIYNLEEISRCYNINKVEDSVTNLLDSVITRIATKSVD
uniref:Putative cell growth regulatory protein cgr11 n=1 Tax=Panstrongylus megistus TaxID=65343 RepID=A0A069DPU7_9HEMI